MSGPLMTEHIKIPSARYIEGHVEEASVANENSEEVPSM